MQRREFAQDDQDIRTQAARYEELTWWGGVCLALAYATRPLVDHIRDDHSGRYEFWGMGYNVGGSPSRTDSG